MPSKALARSRGSQKQKKNIAVWYHAALLARKACRGPGSFSAMRLRRNKESRRVPDAKGGG